VRGSGKSAPPVAKLLDFGLAKPAAPTLLGAGRATATATPPTLTAPGTIIGTVQYMAPEQLEGQEADTRTDIFAFGTVVYEMVTGRKAFEGKSEASLIGAIMQGDPPTLSASQPLTPPLLDRIVKKCLAKEPDERWQSARDVRSQLQWVVEVGTGLPQAGTGATAPVRRRLGTLAWAFVALLAGAALVIGLRSRNAAAPIDDRPVVRATMLLPAALNVAATAQPNRLAMSPDGRRLAFVAAGSDLRKNIWIYSLEGASAQPLAGTEEAVSPFWSPDNRFVGFFADGKLKKIEASGGPALTVCKIPGMSPGSNFATTAARGTWNQSGVILFSVMRKLYRVDSAGEPVLVNPTGASPFFLPDGAHFLYRAVTENGTGIYAERLDGRDHRLLVQGVVSQPLYSQGYLLYVQDHTLLARRFDPNRLEVLGEAIPLASPVSTGTGANSAFSVSATGVIAYEAADSVATPSRLVWFDRAGKQTGSIGDEADYRIIELSSNGTRLAASIVAPGSITADLWLFDLSRGSGGRFTSSPDDVNSAIWSPDDERVVFGLSDHGIHDKPSDLIGEAKLLLKPPSNGPTSAESWSRDGRFIIYKTERFGPVWILPMQKDRAPIPLPALSGDAHTARFSPDGQWIAYSSTESGRSEVYVAPFPGRAGKRMKVSVDGGSLPRWRRDGKELFFVSNDRKLMSADSTPLGGGLEFGVPRTLFQTQMKDPISGWPYDVTPDGNRFLINVTTTTPPSVTLLVNWPALLKK
jgi:Tol biopolymer transport system component